MSKKANLEFAVISTSQLSKNFEPLLAKFIKEELKLKVIFLVKTKKDEIYYNQNFPNIFDKTFTYSIDHTDGRGIKISPNIEEAAVKFEKKYGCSIYRLFFNHRVIGRGFFASGGVRHPRNRAHQEGSHKIFMDIALNKINFWENLFKNNKVKLAINIPHYAHEIALKNNTKSLRLFAGRFKNTYAWTSVMGINPRVSRQELESAKPLTLKKYFLKTPYKSHLDQRKILIKKLGLNSIVKKSIYRTLQLIYGKLRGYEKSKNSYITDEVFYLWKYRKSYFEYVNYTKTNYEKIEDKKFIFFPLLTEPEEAIHGTAKDFFFQLSALNVLARDLPADYRIVVKEHLLALGRRPKDFYRQISQHKNIIFADPKARGLDLIKKCKAVACITGSSAWEASVMGVPVISFSKYNEFNILNHVFVVDNFKSLRDIFLKLEKNEFPNKKSILEGAKFYAAYLKKFVDVKDYNSLSPLENSISQIPDNLHGVANILFKNLKKKYLSNKKVF